VNPTVGYFLDSGAGGPAENMAVDELLLRKVDQTGIPVLRIYTWREPTLSLGYFQRYRDRSLHPPSHGVAVVRRATGGGAILHHHELTYSIVMPISSRQTAARLALYRQLHDVFIQIMARRGVGLARSGDTPGSLADDTAFLCFQRRSADDLVLAGYKVLGSAQRRARRAVLQHGSLLLAASRHAPEIPGVCELTGHAVAPEDLIRDFVEFTTKITGIDWEMSPDALCPQAELAEIVRDRFGDLQWLQGR